MEQFSIIGEVYSSQVNAPLVQVLVMNVLVLEHPDALVVPKDST